MATLEAEFTAGSYRKVVLTPVTDRVKFPLCKTYLYGKYVCYQFYDRSASVQTDHTLQKLSCFMRVLALWYSHLY